jgi:hypothetical protein
MNNGLSSRFALAWELLKSVCQSFARLLGCADPAIAKLGADTTQTTNKIRLVCIMNLDFDADQESQRAAHLFNPSVLIGGACGNRLRHQTVPPR